MIKLDDSATPVREAFKAGQMKCPVLHCEFDIEEEDLPERPGGSFGAVDGIVTTLADQREEMALMAIFMTHVTDHTPAELMDTISHFRALAEQPRAVWRTAERAVAAKRVLAYLDVRTRQSNHDPEILSTVVAVDEELDMPVERHLYAGDLRELASSGRSSTSVWWSGVVGRVDVPTTDGRTLLPPVEADPFERLPLPVTVPLPVDLLGGPEGGMGAVVGSVEVTTIRDGEVRAAGWIDSSKLSADTLAALMSEEGAEAGLYLVDVLAEGTNGDGRQMAGWTAGGVAMGAAYRSAWTENPCMIRLGL